MRFFEHIDNALMEAEKRVEYAASEPRVWPSEASAVLLDQRESTITGKCHRASFFRLIGEPITDPNSAKSARRFRMGRACEDDVTLLSRQAGIHIANGVRYFIPRLTMSLEMDLIVLDPDTNQPVIVENKSSYGYWAKKDMEAGRPKLSAIMQCCMYLNEIKTGAELRQIITKGLADRLAQDATGKKHRNRIEVTAENLARMSDGPLAAKLTYESRDECDTWEFDLSLWTDPEDGSTYPEVNGEPWKVFTMESVYDRYDVLRSYWYVARAEAERRLMAEGYLPPPSDAPEDHIQEWHEQITAEVRNLGRDWWPPAEYEFRYSPEKIDFLAAEGIISKRKYSDYLNRKPGKETMGNWNCAFCSYRKKCVAMEYPQLSSLALDFAMEEEAA